MPFKPTLFVVTDIETTMKKRMAFDIAWRIVDKRGREYGSGSYVVREAFRHDVPFFAKKLGHYFDDAYSQLIKPASIFEVREEYNGQIGALQAAGHRVIACAYNAAFDFKYLPETIQQISGNASERWMQRKDYSTSAENAYRWEFNQSEFEERHIAWHDCLIESDILLKAIGRKKAMPIVSRPSELAGAIWKKINTRLGVDGKTLLPVAA